MNQILKTIIKNGKTLKVLKQNTKLPVARIRRLSISVEMMGNALSVKETDYFLRLLFNDSNSEQSYWMVPLRDGMVIECGYGASIVHRFTIKQDKEFPDGFAIIHVPTSCGIARILSRNYVDLPDKLKSGSVAYIVFYRNKACYETTNEGYMRLIESAKQNPDSFYEILDLSYEKAIADVAPALA